VCRAFTFSVEVLGKIRIQIVFNAVNGHLRIAVEVCSSADV
jgi:hypothetical protein